jgi:hypothetical protein
LTLPWKSTELTKEADKEMSCRLEEEEDKEIELWIWEEEEDKEDPLNLVSKSMTPPKVPLTTLKNPPGFNQDRVEMEQRHLEGHLPRGEEEDKEMNLTMLFRCHLEGEVKKDRLKVHLLPKSMTPPKAP